MGLRFIALVALTWGSLMPASVWQLDTAAIWNSNVTNAEVPGEDLSGLLWQTEVRTTAWQHRLRGQHVALHLGARSEIWPRFQGLDRLAPGAFATWDWKPGLGPHRPVLHAAVEIEPAFAAESARRGLGGAGRLAVRQRLGTAWLLLAGHEWRRFDARDRAFDVTGRQWFGRMEAGASAGWRFAFEASGRVGDVVSYSRPPRPDLTALGKPITTVDTFEQAVPWIAYYFRASTRVTAFEVMRTWGHRTNLTLRHEFRHTRHKGQGYRNQITSLSLSRSIGAK